jgi:DNA-binding NarL/FixJ family response regulator
LIVLDLKLADDDPFSALTDGFAFLRVLRSTYPEAQSPVVIFSGEVPPPVQAQARAMGVFGVVSKAQGVSTLMAAVKDALAHRKNKGTETETPQSADVGSDN